MSSTLYVAPTSLLDTAPPRGAWHGTASMADPTQSLVVVIEWNDSDAPADFETQPGVVLVGLPWETVPAEAVHLLALFQDAIAEDVGAVAVTTSPSSVTDAPIAPQSVSTALRLISWPGARLVR